MFKEFLLKILLVLALLVLLVGCDGSFDINTINHRRPICRSRVIHSPVVTTGQRVVVITPNAVRAIQQTCPYCRVIHLNGVCPYMNRYRRIRPTIIRKPQRHRRIPLTPGNRFRIMKGKRPIPMFPVD